MGTKKYIKFSQKELLNCFGKVTYMMYGSNSQKETLRWLYRINKFLNKAIGVKQRLKNEKTIRKMGW